MKDYISSTNFMFNSTVFPSSSITKVVLQELKEPKTRFRIIHRIVRTILKKWETLSYCNHIETTHYAHCKKTKMIVQFNNYGFSNFILKILPIPV